VEGRASSDRSSENDNGRQGSNRRPTIDDVARQAGVSIATVSRVINRPKSVAPETIHRVQQAINTLEYIPLAAARNLAGQRTGALGLIMPFLGNSFFSPLMNGIERGCQEAGYDLLIYSGQTRTLLSSGLSARLGLSNTDGLLVFTNALSDRELFRLHRENMPLALLHRTAPEGLKIPSVTVENQMGAYQVVSHMIELHGRRRVAFLAGPPGNEDAARREAGYLKSMNDHGLSVDRSLYGQGGFDELQAEEIVSGWLACGLDFDAIFAADDGSAIGAANALRKAGWPVPGKVSLAGFDDVEISRYFSPSLTTVRAPTEQLGLEGVRQLVRQIETGQVEPSIVLPTEPVYRQSCGC
jgi:DNA-binding LacI/PurR family transcriptional regulator